MFASNLTRIKRRGMYFLTALTLLLTPLLSASNLSVRAAPAYTEVGGPIISNTTWTLANSPYIVVANVEVWQGVTLTIEAGVVVKFNKDKLLQVDGTLIARGTAASPITFTSNQASPQKGDWKNIKFTDSSVDAAFDGAGNYTGGSILEYCVVEYGGNGVDGAVRTDQASPLIDHCTVSNNDSSGVHAAGTSDSLVMIRNSTISGNSIPSCNYWDCFAGGAGIYASYATVTSNAITGNGSTGRYRFFGGGIYAANSTVMGNTISGNLSSYHGGGIYAESSTVASNIVSDNSATSYSGWGGGIYAVSSTVTGNIVSGNSAHSAHNYYGWGGGIYAEGSTVIDNIVTGNSAPGYYGGGGGIHAEGGTVTGNVVTGNSAPGYYADGGGIYIRLGTAAGNFVSGNTASNCGGIYAYRNSLVKENTVTGNSAPTGGGICAGWFSQAIGNTVSGNSAVEGGGIFAWDSSSVMSNTVSANGVFTNTGQGSGVYFLRGTADFLYNTVVGNTAISPTVVIGGVAIYGTPQFHHNNLYGNSNYDVVVLSSRDISGTHNYWGSVATVDILAHVYDGDDDSARGRLLYIPYLQDPDPNAPVPPPLNLRATFAGDSASLSWDAIPSTTTGYGYKVYYDTDASGPPYHGTGAAQGDSPVDVGNATHFTLSGLGGGGIYIAVTAYNTQGRESWYSNEVINPWRVYLPAVLR